MKLGISEFKVGEQTIKFKTPLLLDITKGSGPGGGVYVNNDLLDIAAVETTLLECDIIIREELEIMWEEYALVPDDNLSKGAVILKNKLLEMAIEVPMGFDICKVKYPSLNRIIMLYPNPEILLGHRIFWQEKRDGSNMGVYLTKKGDLALRSRNLDRASEDFHRIFLETDEAKKVRELLIFMQQDGWNDECVVFGELLVKGKSPVRTELHKKHEFIVFDIWSSKTGGFMSYTLVHQYCYHFGIPIVEVYGQSRHTTLESLLEFRDKMLEIAKGNGREGVVGKTYEKNTMYKYFKEKIDLPNLRRIPSNFEGAKPILPESEVLGSLDKVLVDLGTTDFKDVRKAMPLFVKYVGVECSKHLCRKPKGTLFTYYKAKLEEVK